MVDSGLYQAFALSASLPEEKDVQPIGEHGDAISGELGQQRGRSGRDRNHEQEGDVNPGKTPVGTGEMVELSLLADPKNAEGHKAHHVHEEPLWEREVGKLGHYRITA